MEKATHKMPKKHHKDTPFQEQFPSVHETLEYAKLAKIVYKVHSTDDPNLYIIPLKYEVSCHYFGENSLDTQVMIVSCDYEKINTGIVHEEKEIKKLQEQKPIYEGFIAVVYRGTSSPWDAAMDAKVNKVPFDVPFVDDDNFTVHSGFNDTFLGDNLHISVTEHLDRLREMKPNHKIVFTGHSLGAALSTLAAVYTACRLPDHNILCVNFGSPRVGTLEFKAYVEGKVKNCAIWRCVLEDDIVTRLPPLSLGYEHVGHLIDFDRQHGALAHFFHIGNVDLGYRGANPKAWDVFPDDSVARCIEDHKQYNYIAYLEDRAIQNDKYFPNEFCRIWHDDIDKEAELALMRYRRYELIAFIVVPTIVTIIAYAMFQSKRS